MADYSSWIYRWLVEDHTLVWDGYDITLRKTSEVEKDQSEYIVFHLDNPTEYDEGIRDLYITETKKTYVRLPDQELPLGEYFVIRIYIGARTKEAMFYWKHGKLRTIHALKAHGISLEHRSSGQIILFR